jgi:PPM family protein phosphatase
MCDIEYKFYSHTDKGKCFNNEDAILTLNLGNGNYFFAVADGMGVNDGGEVASSVSLYMMEKRLKHFIAQSRVSPSTMKETMASLFDAAREAISQFTEVHPELMGMGTTLTAILIHDNKFVWGHIGDTRLYMIKGDQVSRLTHDHTVSEDPSNTHMDMGVLLPSQKVTELTRKIDGQECNPDIFPLNKDYLDVEENDTWILCSDGLLVDRRKDFKELFQNFKFTPDTMHCVATAMVKKALQNGSTDNISVITITAANKSINNSQTKAKPLSKQNPSVPDQTENGFYSSMLFVKNGIEGLFSNFRLLPT